MILVTTIIKSLLQTCCFIYVISLKPYTKSVKWAGIIIATLEIKKIRFT